MSEESKRVFSRLPAWATALVFIVAIVVGITFGRKVDLGFIEIGPAVLESDPKYIALKDEMVGIRSEFGIDSNDTENNAQKTVKLLAQKYRDITRLLGVADSPTENDAIPKIKELLRQPKRIVMIDTLQPKNNVYREATREAGGTNGDDITEILSKLGRNVILISERVHRDWNRSQQIKDMNPDLVIIHYSTFEDEQYKDPQRKELVKALRIIGPKAKRIIVYSRTPNFNQGWQSRFFDLQNDSGIMNKIKPFEVTAPDNTQKIENMGCETVRQFSDKCHQVLAEVLRDLVRDMIDQM